MRVFENLQIRLQIGLFTLNSTSGTALFRSRLRTIVRPFTHESKTDPDAKLFRKGKSQPAKLYFMGQALIEKRNGPVVQADAMQATGKAERAAALAMIDRQDPGSERLTLAADKGYDTSDFVSDLRQKCVTPPVAAKVTGSAIDGHHAARGLQGQPA